MAGSSHIFALILAGGSGTRFWPLSRDSRPKQLIDLFGDGTLLAQAVQRLDGLVPPENILVLTNGKQLEAVRANLPMLPAANIFAEPAKRDTAPAVALGIGLIAARDPQALMVVLPADQLIRDTAGFQATLRAALAVAAGDDGLVTIGIKPTWPCPSYGYIELGAPAGIAGADPAHPPFEVRRFREKPHAELAAEFLAQGGFVWNAGMFVWSVAAVTAQLARHAPDLAGFIDALRASDDVPGTVNEAFPQLHARSIDYALMEKADRVLNIAATFDWDDVGSWISVAGYLGEDAGGNRCNAETTALDATRNIVFNANPGCRVALLGVDDLIIVQTADALLVANRHQADAIKNLTPLLPEELR